LLDDSLGGRVHVRLLTACVGLRANVTGRAVLAQHFLDEGKTDAEHIGNGALRAEPPLAGT
jgi:hypothetical protein